MTLYRFGDGHGAISRNTESERPVPNPETTKQLSDRRFQHASPRTVAIRSSLRTARVRRRTNTRPSANGPETIEPGVRCDAGARPSERFR